MVLGFAGLAGAVTIDFNELPVGTQVTDQYAAQGVTFSLLDVPSGSSLVGPVAVELGSTYLPASGIAVRPSVDNSIFYDIVMDFSTDISYFSMLSLDSDEPITVYGYLDGVEVASVYYAPGSDKQVWEMVLDGGRFDKVVLDLVAGPGRTGYAGGPEIFDNLEFTPTPEPGTVILLGLGLLGLVSQRKRFKK